MVTGALQGMKVLELGAQIAVPGACAILSDWGADVIKVEDPQGGDPGRGLKSIENIKIVDINPWNDQLNRNKRSIGLNTKLERSKEVLYRLVRSSDVVVTNFRLSYLRKIQADYDSLRKINPKLVYCLLSGYGTAGQDKEKPGFDYTAFWARSGMMDRLTEPGGVPRAVRPGMGDSIAAIAIVGAITAALLARERTGEGQKLELNLYQLGVWTMGIDIEAALYFGQEINQTDRQSVANPLWNFYKTKDGKWMLLAMPYTDTFWLTFCKAIGKPDLAEDPKFDSHDKRLQQNTILIPLIDGVMAERTASEWDEIFKQEDLVYSKVATPLEVVHDPQAWENSFFTEAQNPAVGKLKLIQSPFQFSKTPASIKSCAPEVGQHTEEILIHLGYTWDDIGELKTERVIT